MHGCVIAVWTPEMRQKAGSRATSLSWLTAARSLPLFQPLLDDIRPYRFLRWMCVYQGVCNINPGHVEAAGRPHNVL